MIGSKAKNQPWSDALMHSLKPYNAELSHVDNPVIYSGLKNEDQVRTLIKWAIHHQAIIIPIGGNTNLVEASTFRPTEEIKVDQPILYVKYMDKSIKYDKEKDIVIAGPMVELHDIHNFLNTLNLRFPVNFSAQNATLGGIASTNAGGEYGKFSNSHYYTDIICGDSIKRRLKPAINQTDSMLPNVTAICCPPAI